MNGQIIEPIFLNIEYFFYQILVFVRGVFRLFARIDIDINLSLFLQIVFTLGVILLLIILFYSYLRVKELKEEQRKKLAQFTPKEIAPEPENERWAYVVKQMQSENPSDWKLAIIEADAMLDEMVARMGYEGKDLGERLKQIERSDFTTLDSAWEAHKVRNRIAHDGSSFAIEKREARRIIALFEDVFREFGFI